ncbi:hypothetical protein MUN82_07080 [Hymenobacter aerilatus]|uniref:STAS/SEC14 domain-containing protein n=1 Tax=Hymenobacter aerilatus TaxID=2932251 RepID=A0A8T9SYV3_9BACT|nr:hypothetical protein [Hymenobacter aerilatus]UOR06857.1 hypothetical protein MUN82_07080 [Hymenobacter aerilatus]
MILRTILDFVLQYDEVASVLRVEWVSGRNVQQLRRSAGQLLLLLQQLAVRRLVIDMNSVPDLSVDDEIWLGTHWMPGLVALPLERLVLVLDSGQTHNQLAINALHDLAQPAIRFDAQYFSDTDSAMHWISDDSPHLLPLLAEWNARHDTPPAPVG